MREIAVLQRPAECCAPIAAEDLSEQEAATTATLFKALSDSNRVRIVNRLALSREAVCVCDITALLDVSQPTVSFHLKKLVDAGLLDREQRGVWAYYSLNDRAAERLAGVFRFEGGNP
jgi:ArsR family transcriptional regulator